jgi:arginine deiminase
MCINVVALEPGKIIMPSGSPNTKKKLEEANVEVIEVELGEIMKGWGAIHCMSVFLNRDPIL